MISYSRWENRKKTTVRVNEENIEKEKGTIAKLSKFLNENAFTCRSAYCLDFGACA